MMYNQQSRYHDGYPMKSFPSLWQDNNTVKPVLQGHVLIRGHPVIRGYFFRTVSYLPIC